MLDHVDMPDCKPALSPIVENTDPTRNPEDASDEELIRSYQSYIGTHIWVYVCSRPDLGYVVYTLTWFSSNLTREHIIAVKPVYRYLQTTKDLKIVYQGGSLKNRVSKFMMIKTGLVTKRHRSQPLETLPCLQDVLFPCFQNGKVPLLSHPRRRNILLPPGLQRRLFKSVVFLRNYFILIFIPYLCTSTIKGRLRWQKILKIISVQNT